MKREIYLYDASWRTLGGGEKYLCFIAEVLSRDPCTSVSLLLDAPTVTPHELRSRFGLGLEHVLFRPIRRGQARRALASADYGITLSNVSSLGNTAKHNIIVLQMPYRPFTPAALLRRTLREGPKEAAKEVLRLALLRDARRSDLLLTYSEFTRDRLRSLHHLNAEVLYPPIDDFSGPLPKEHIILSVGRFFRGLYNDKRYDILLRAFRDLCHRLPSSSWEYHLIGSCGSDAASRRLVAGLQRLSAGLPVHLHLNLPYERLREFYQRATIFWHAAGFGVDEDRYPDRTEHFGMSTVEAMSAEAIPFAVNAGGQKEILSGGRAGILWNSIDELVEATLRLIQEPSRWPSLRQQARKRFLDFSHEKFADRLLTLLQPHLEEQRVPL